jgi:hypothetical protein
VVALDQGGLFNDVESIVWVFNTRDGLHDTTAEAWEASNSTVMADDDDAIITLHAYLRSIGNTRALYYTVWVATAAWASIFHPTECSILKNAARRSVIGGSQEDEVEETPSTADANTREGPHELQRHNAQRSLTTYQEEQVDATIDAESEATANRLGDDDEVIVFMPAEEIIIPDGPKRSMLCVLLFGNYRMAKYINDFLEEHKVWGQIPLLPSLIVAMVALTEAIPLNLTWLGIVLLPDTARCFFKLNAQAVKLCISEPFDFMVPCVTLTLAMVGAMASFEFHPGCCAGLISFGFLYLTQILLGKAV